jgi:putative inorganic carbon (hco3(-)) transporter
MKTKMNIQYEKYKHLIVSFGSLVLLSIWPYAYLAAEPHDGQRLISSILIALALLSSLWFTKLSLKLLRTVVVVFLWCILSVWVSPMSFWSLLEFAMLFSVGLLSISLFQKVDEALIKKLAVIFVFIQAFYISQNLTYYIAIMLSSDIMVPYTLATGFSNMRFYAQFLIWTVPFVLGVLAIYPKLAYRNVILIVLMFGWTYQYLTGTRAFMLAMAVTVPAVWLFTTTYKMLWKQYLKWLLITAAGGFILYALMLFVIPSLCGVNVELALDYSARRNMLDSRGRVYLWQEAWRLMSEHPWLGAGPMMTAMLVDLKTSAHPHNFVLQLLAEWGIPFTCTLIFLLTFGIIRWKKLIEINSIKRIPMALPIVASLSAGVAAGMVDGLIVMPVSLVYMTIIIGLLAGLWRTWTPADARISFPKWLIPIFAAPAVYVAIYTINMWPERNVASELRKPIVGNSYHIVQDENPRFWVTGHIVLDKSDSKK